LKKILLTAILASALIIVVSLALYLALFTQPEKLAAAAKFTLMSTAFKDHERIPEKYTCEGLDVSPPLRWEGYPAETVSFVLIVEDPDAPGGTFTHWIVYNIPSDVNELEEGASTMGKLPPGALQGRNDFGKIGYGGPCPPPGKAHRYVFKLYALDSMLDLGAGADRSDVLKAIRGHVLAEASLTGLYSRMP